MSRASGIGSWPGADVRQALSAVRELLSEDGLPYLPELPARGPGADIIGRGAGLLAELAVDLQPMGWRFVDRPGRDAHRTSALMRQDLDELAEAFDGYHGDLKVQIAGPWTLASSIWLHRGERSVVDVGATRDLIASLAACLPALLCALTALLPPPASRHPAGVPDPDAPYPPLLDRPLPRLLPRSSQWGPLGRICLAGLLRHRAGRRDPARQVRQPEGGSQLVGRPLRDQHQDSKLRSGTQVPG